MVSVNNSQQSLIPTVGLPTSTILVATSGSTIPQNTSYSPSDAFKNTSGVTLSSQSQAIDPNKKAGFSQRFMNNVGNAFGKVADFAGLGTISHFAKENFKSLDSNSDNNLNINEFSAVSQLIGKNFQQVDSNSNQQISFGEFKKIVGNMVDSEVKRLDTNTDGFLNMNETLAGGYRDCDFNSHDTNKDGLLSRNEFASLLNDVKIKKH